MLNRRAILRDGVDFRSASVLEIGALCSPVIEKSEADVTYVDWADTATLVAKYQKDRTVDVSKIVPVDAVWGKTSLAECVDGRRFDYVIASHVAEHVPDLISWLQEVGSILKPSGELRLVLPDKRFSFDYLRAETDISDLLAAYFVKARRPQLREIVDFKVHVSFKADGCSQYAGTQERGEVVPLHSYGDVELAARTFLEQPDAYTDVHCWVFTPGTFARLMAQLAKFDLLSLACSGFVDTTQEHGFEYYVSLTAARDQHHAVDSWKRMVSEAAEPLPGSAAAKQLEEVQQRLRESDAPIRLEAALEELAHAHRRIAALEQSNSWRITAPIRKIVSAMRSVKSSTAV